MTGEAGIAVSFRGRFGSFVLDASFTAPRRGVTALHGPSGCGKTSVLRCIAGLARVPEGMCRIADETWQDAASFRPPHRRAVGYVFQEASLFPHLDVRGNLLYGAPADHRGSSGLFGEMVELLGLAALVERSPRHLSGGERQRVAIGRAMLSRPSVLLMDEPLSALDGRAKDEILPFLERLHESLALPVLYVSHDVAEVGRLADTLVLMDAGRVIASGPLATLQADPALPLAGGRDAAVSLDGYVEDYDPGYGLLRVRVSGGQIVVPAKAHPGNARVRLRVAATDVSLALEAPRQTSILNALPARVVSLDAASPHEIIAVLALGEAGEGARVLSRLTRRSSDILALTPGMVVHAQVKGVALARKPDAETSLRPSGP